MRVVDEAKMEVPLVLMPRKELGENVDVNEPFTVAMRRRGEAILKGVEVEGHGGGVPSGCSRARDR